MAVGEKNTLTLCEKKGRLLAEYKILAIEFSKAVSKLHERVGSLGEKEYMQLNMAAGLARLRSEHGRLALQQHIAEHRCEENGS